MEKESSAFTVAEHMEHGFDALDIARVGQPGSDRAALLANAHFSAALVLIGMQTASVRADWTWR